jgi:hypothetical protein
MQRRSTFSSPIFVFVHVSSSSFIQRICKQRGKLRPQRVVQSFTRGSFIIPAIFFGFFVNVVPASVVYEYRPNLAAATTTTTIPTAMTTIIITPMVLYGAIHKNGSLLQLLPLMIETTLFSSFPRSQSLVRVARDR